MENGNMKKTIYIRILGICCLALIMQGCFNFQLQPEKFENEEYGALVVQAENNLLGIYDNWATYCEELEKDSYGRKIYVFWGKTRITRKGLYEGYSHVWAILIQQKIEDGYVYYYEDISYILRDCEFSINISDHHDEFINATIGSLSDSEIDKLKEENDWDKEYNDEKMTKKVILKFNLGLKLKNVSEERLVKVFNTHFSDKYSSWHGFYTYLTSDDYGRHIYFCRTLDENEMYNHFYLIMFYDIEKYKVFEISNALDYRDEIIEFKRENNWGKPVE